MECTSIVSERHLAHLPPHELPIDSSFTPRAKFCSRVSQALQSTVDSPFEDFILRGGRHWYTPSSSVISAR